MIISSLRTQSIPQELKALDRWVCWRWGDAKKIPIDPRTGKAAKCNDSSTWTTFSKALRGLRETRDPTTDDPVYEGLMFALDGDGLVLVDLDKCRNPNNKRLKVSAAKIAAQLNSYAEVSPSGTGVHILLRGTKPGDLCRRANVEVYSHGRFVTMTGRRLKSYSENVEERQAELGRFYHRHIAPISQNRKGAEVLGVLGVPIPQEKLDALLKHDKARAIYQGEHTGYSSQSEGDLALANIAVAQKWSEAEIRTLLEAARENAGAEAKHDGYFHTTYHKAAGKVEPVPLGKARAAFQKWLYLPDPKILDVMLAVVATGHLPGDPLWLHVVGPPSSAKTEVLNSMAEWPGVYALTELTPAGLVSGRDSEDGKDHSLLPHLHGKTLAIKDLTPTLDAPKELRAKLFGRLRDAFDGSQAIHTAMVGTRSHKGTFNCLDCVTSVIDRLGRNTSLGERYLLYRHQAPDAEKSAERALQGVTSKKEMRAALAKAACGVLAGADQDSVPEASEPIRKRIVKMAMLLAVGRTFIERSRDHRIVAPPESEGPARIAQQLFKLGQGLALINRRVEVAEADLSILARVTLDSLPLVRRSLLEALAKQARGKLVGTKTLTDLLGMGQPSVHEKLEELVILKMVTKKQKGRMCWYGLTAEYRPLVEVPNTSGTFSTAPSGLKMRNRSRDPNLFRKSGPKGAVLGVPEVPNTFGTAMYEGVKTWSPFKGCEFACTYCVPSFQRLARRQKCSKCKRYVPHEHPERLGKVPSGAVIFACASSDISFAEPKYVRKILARIRQRPKQTFYLQSKRPEYFDQFSIPPNVVLVTTLETNRDEGYAKVSKAPVPSERYEQFKALDYPRKIVTIEPVMDFDLEIFSTWVAAVKPECVWVGFNSKVKEVQLPEPSQEKIEQLIERIEAAGIEVRRKKMKN